MSQDNNFHDIFNLWKIIKIKMKSNFNIIEKGHMEIRRILLFQFTYISKTIPAK